MTQSREAAWAANEASPVRSKRPNLEGAEARLSSQERAAYVKVSHFTILNIRANSHPAHTSLEMFRFMRASGG